MRKRLAVVAVVATAGFASSAVAGVYQDDLSRCLVKSAAPADQIVFMRWMFSMLALHPSVGDMAKITADQRVSLEKGGAQLFQRLLVNDCRKEAVAAIKYEGETSLVQSFEVLGQVAIRNLTTDPKVAAGFAEFGSYADPKAFGDLEKEAGVPTTSPVK
jgi:hypothetical protein